MRQGALETTPTSLLSALWMSLQAVEVCVQPPSLHSSAFPFPFLHSSIPPSFHSFIPSSFYPPFLHSFILSFLYSSIPSRLPLSPGLTEGFHQSGVAEALWAVEKDEAAANAFKLNYPNSTVLSDDCNMILRLVMDVRGREREEGERREGGAKEDMTL